jgi:SPP1 family predicted phage head-tail adaptor
MLRSGTLRDLISFTSPGPNEDPDVDKSFGAPIEYSQFAQAWANVTPTDGTEIFTSSGEQSVVTHVIKTFYRPDVDPTDRITYQGKTLSILSVIDPDGRQRELLIKAKLFPGAN